MSTKNTADTPMPTIPLGLVLSGKSLDPFSDTFQASFYSPNGIFNISLSGGVSEAAKSAGDPKAVFKAAAEEMLNEALASVKAL